MNDLKIWILYGLLTGTGAILIFLAKWFFTKAIKILEDIRQEIQDLNHTTTIQDLQLKNHEKELDDHRSRLDRHSNRIMDSEKRVLILEDKLK